MDKSKREFRPAYTVELDGTIQKIEAVVVLPHMVCQACEQPLLGYPDTLIFMVTGQCYFQSPGITFVKGRGMMHSNCAMPLVKEVLIPNPTLMTLLSSPVPHDTSN